MAFARAPDQYNSTPSKPGSHFQRTVDLAEWWLIKSESDFHGRWLAVAGFSSREKLATRVFSSAPILKRYDVCSLETSDGICVFLNGFINRDRTLENGFPSDVCNHFIFGFPPHWKDYVEKFLNISSNKFRVDSLEKPVPHSAPQTRNRGRPRKDLDLHDKMDAEGVPKNKKTKSETPVVNKQASHLVKESPVTNEQKVHSSSKQELVFNRSRSGRLLMPTLEFWRNQRAIYDENGTVTGIQEDRNPEQPRKGSGRKRKP